MKIPLKNPQPNVDWFIQVIKGELTPRRPPLIELFLDEEIVAEIAKDLMGLDWSPRGEDRESRSVYWDRYIEVHYRLGYDTLRASGDYVFEFAYETAGDTADLNRGDRQWYGASAALITDWESFEKYPWPDPGAIDLWDYEYLANHVPEGMGLLANPTSGFLEVPMDGIIGYENLAYMIYDNPELVEAVFTRTAEVIQGLYQRLVGLPNLVGFFQGDDMGFKTSTLVSPAFLREHVLPEHRKLAELAHENGLLYFLHSCGNLEKIYEDLISDVGIDGKHSFEDVILPISEFKHRYGDRVAALGGVDVDKLSRLPESELREYVRGIIEKCLPGGRFALGSGNTVANYVPVRNYIAMVEEGLNWNG
jgi:uroporphyrinogen decarboxylase